MVNFNDIESIRQLKSHFHAVFENKSGDQVMEFLEALCNWYPLAGESSETNDIIARDARRQILATIKTFLKCSPEEIKKVAEYFS